VIELSWRFGYPLPTLRVGGQGAATKATDTILFAFRILIPVFSVSVSLCCIIHHDADGRSESREAVLCEGFYVCVVTGGGSGIGLMAAQALAANDSVPLRSMHRHW